jgi:putative glutamine amidotransferase
MVTDSATAWEDRVVCWGDAGAQRHTFYPDVPFDLLAHPVQIVANSRLARIVGGPTLAVNSMHHQACREVGAGLHMIARAPDGLIEALEVPDHPFALAVQWHPEALPEVAEMRALFGALVAACAQRSE